MNKGRHPLRRDWHRHWIVTDSGLGGLSVCAEIERNLRNAGTGHNLHITYFNAWPDPHSGYNSLPDMQSRADAFNHALVRMDQLGPDRIIIACNTLSILYGLTRYSRNTPVPVLGIIEAGVDLFSEALVTDPAASILLIGTRTTIESQAHRDGMIRKGTRAERIATHACHGLAAAIEKDPGSAAVTELLETCLSGACSTIPSGVRLHVGLCCTHYTYVKEAIRSTMERLYRSPVRILDPNQRLADRAVASLSGEPAESSPGVPTVAVLSKVELDDNQRRLMAGQVEDVSAITARALLSYTRDPDLF